MPHPSPSLPTLLPPEPEHKGSWASEPLGFRSPDRLCLSSRWVTERRDTELRLAGPPFVDASVEDVSLLEQCPLEVPFYKFRHPAAPATSCSGAAIK